jgi:hypothetical protein
LSRWFERARAQIVAGFVVWIGLLIFGWFTLPRYHVVEMLCLITFSVSSGVLTSFGPISWDAITNRRPDTSDLLAIGAFLKSLALVVLSGWIIGYRVVYGDTPQLRESLVFIIILAVSTYGGLLYLVSERSLPGEIPSREWIRGGIWVAGGLFMFGVFLLVVT